MTKNYWLFFLLLCSFASVAQYTEVINSSRPGLAETPYAVGSEIFQIETGYNYDIEKFFADNRDVINNTLTETLRTGFWFDKMEFQVLLEQNLYKYNINGGDNFSSNTGALTGLGFKYFLFEPKIIDKSQEVRSWKKRTQFNWRSLLPSIALKVSGSVVSNTNEITSFNSTGNAKLWLLLQNHISDKWVVISNIGYERNLILAEDDLNIFNIIAAATYNLNHKWSFFGEGSASIQSTHDNLEFRAGTAYLVHDNLQLDASLRGSLDNLYNSTGVSVGLSWRVDNHVDKPPKQEKKKKVIAVAKSEQEVAEDKLKNEMQALEDMENELRAMEKELLEMERIDRGR